MHLTNFSGLVSLDLILDITLLLTFLENLSAISFIELNSVFRLIQNHSEISEKMVLQLLA